MPVNFRLCFYIYTAIVVVIALCIGYFIGIGLLKFDPVFILIVVGFIATFAMRMLILHFIGSLDDAEEL